MTETALPDHGRQEVPIPQDLIAALLQLGHAHTAAATPRRRSADVPDRADGADR